MCEICQNWPRANIEIVHFRNKGIPLLPDHHPNCPHYNDSLIDVWKVSNGKDFYYVGGETTGIDGCIVIKEKMHKEIFDNLPEFEGF